MTTDSVMTRNSEPPSPEALWQSRQLIALAEATQRCAEALQRALAGSVPALRDMADLMVTDAQITASKARTAAKRVEAGE